MTLVWGTGKDQSYDLWNRSVNLLVYKSQQREAGPLMTAACKSCDLTANKMSSPFNKGITRLLLKERKFSSRYFVILVTLFPTECRLHHSISYYCCLASGFLLLPSRGWWYFSRSFKHIIRLLLSKQNFLEGKHIAALFHNLSKLPARAKEKAGSWIYKDCKLSWPRVHSSRSLAGLWHRSCMYLILYFG